MEIPGGLIDAIGKGACVAFVGAGFSAAAGVPQWGEMLQKIAGARGIEPAVRAYVERRVRSGSARDLDEAAEVLEHELGTERFIEAISESVSNGTLTEKMRRRLDWLKGTPFRAILTVNFDGLLRGRLPCAEAFRAVLRPEPRLWWDPSFWGRDPEGPPVVKLHGDVADPKSIVLTRRGYRRRIYADSAYREFLRNVFAQHTVLFMGFSFVDAYLNELRSETLALLGQRPSDIPVAYAIINDVDEIAREQFLRTEGIEVLTYDSTRPPAFGGFDEILGEIHRLTNPALRLGRLMGRKRVLWVDAHGLKNHTYQDFLSEISGAHGGDACTFEEAADAPAAMERIAHAKEPFDLVITHWGGTTAVRLLQAIREKDVRSPVIVFSGDEDLSNRKRQVLTLGAQGYCVTIEGLLRTIARVLEPDVETA